jgi:HlyD family secretion protein
MVKTQALFFRWTKNINPWIAGLLVTGTIGATVVFYLKTQATTAQADLTSQTVLVTTEDWVAQTQGNGVVKAVQKINLSPEDSGRIAELYVTEGNRVQQGQIIARMNSDRLQVQVEQYKAFLQRAQAELAEKRAGSRPEEIREATARMITAKASVASAQARLDRAKQELSRNQLLAREGAITRNSFEEFITKQREAQASLNAELSRLAEQQAALVKAQTGARVEEIAQAEANVAQAEAQLAYYQTQVNNTIIRAPFAGIITRRFAQEGDFVTPTTSASSSEGATSASIAELSNGLEIEAKVSEANIAQISVGQTVEIQVDSYPNETFKGKVSLISPRAVQENNITFFPIKVALPENQTKLRLGMNVRLTFLSKPIKNVLVIPLAAVVTQANGQTGVYVADTQNQTRFQVIKVSTVSGDRVRVLEGLNEGDRVLISPPSNEKIDGVDTVGF